MNAVDKSGVAAMRDFRAFKKGTTDIFAKAIFFLLKFDYDSRCKIVTRNDVRSVK